MIVHFSEIGTAIGISFLFAATEGGICRAAFGLSRDAFAEEIEGTLGATVRYDKRLLRHAREEFQAYFLGHLRRFTLPIDLRDGTPFQRKVWQSLKTIPYGETRTYAEQAAVIGHPRSVRAVGAANRKNPIPILLPCHRVIGSDGKLRGFRGGIEIKAWLLALEGEGNTSTTGTHTR